jgi:hypothetical protein
MGGEVSKRTRKAFEDGLSSVPVVTEVIRSGKIQTHVYCRKKFYAKVEVIGSAAFQDLRYRGAQVSDA